MVVWGVKNFHVALYRLCEEGSEFTPGYFALVAVAALLATGGLLSNSIPVVIGSMCVVAFLVPSRFLSLGVIIGYLYQRLYAGQHSSTTKGGFGTLTQFREMIPHAARRY
jgi:hypothetical protein